MVGRQLNNLYFNNDVEYISNDWTDHVLMTVSLRLQVSNTGNGLWRANPNLVHHKSYVKKVNSGISHFMGTIRCNSTNNSQLKWDRLEGYITKLTKAYCSNRSSWPKDWLRELQSNRNQLIRQYKHDQQTLQLQLSSVERDIARLEHKLARNASLKVGMQWLNNNENLVGCLKRTAERRLAQRHFNNITHPTSGNNCTSTDDKLEAVHSFYEELYSTEPTHPYWSWRDFEICYPVSQGQ